MLIGYFARVLEPFSLGLGGVVPGYIVIILTPLGMMLASVFGVHLYNSTVMAPGGRLMRTRLLMQAHLLAWGGTMSSLASLENTCANLFKVPSRQLVLGPNLWTALVYALVGGIILSVVNVLV